MHLEIQVIYTLGNPAIIKSEGMPLSPLECELEIDYRAGKVIEALAQMVGYSNLIKQGKNPKIKPFDVFIYKLMISEFEHSHRGCRLLGQMPEIRTRVHEAYKIINKYVFGVSNFKIKLSPSIP